MALFSFSRLLGNKAETSVADVFYEMLNRTQATIQFLPDGTILTANENFLACVGYTLDEIVDKHHSIFVSPDYVQTETYRDFWRNLAGGKSFTDQFARIRKDGAEIWIQAT